MLKIDRITVKFGELNVLRSLTLEVSRGTMVGLVGGNGAGKTTIMKSLMGLVPVDSGEIILDDQKVHLMDTLQRVRLGIGYMPEDRRLIGPLTVEDNLLLPAWAQGRKHANLDAVYDLIPEVKALIHQKGTQLSGGQQKLVALARSFATADKLLLLDEPMEGVSLALSSRMAEAIQGLKERKPDLSILAAESDLTRMRLLTDNISTVERGEILAQN